MNKYKELDRAVKRSCKADRRAWITQKGSEAENAAQRNDAKTKARFNVVRELTGAKSNSNVPVKDKTGKTLVTAEEQNARGVEHFKEVLNQPLITYDFNTF